MGVKESLKNVAGDLGTLSTEYKNMMLPRYEETRGWMQNFRNKELDPFRWKLENIRTDPTTGYNVAGDMYRGMVSDPSKRGYDVATQRKMLGTQMDTLSGQRTAESQNLARQRAATGMGGTGMGMRQAMQQGERYAGAGRAAARDVELAQAEAARSDLWNASRGLMDVENARTQNLGLQQGTLGMSQNLYNQELAALGGEQGVYQGAGGILANKIPALGGANRAGFWGNWGDVTGGIANVLNSGSRAYTAGMGGG